MNPQVLPLTIESSCRVSPCWDSNGLWCRSVCEAIIEIGDRGAPEMQHAVFSLVRPQEEGGAGKIGRYFFRAS